MDFLTIFTLLIPYILSCYGSLIKQSNSASSDHINPDKLHLLTLPDDGASDKCEPAKYSVTKFIRFGCLVVYRIIEGSKCSEVIYDTEPVWKHDPEKNGDKFPFKVVLNTIARVVWIILDNQTYGYMEYNGEWILNIAKRNEILEHTPENQITSYPFNEINTNNLSLDKEDEVENETKPINLDNKLLESHSSQDVDNYLKLKTQILKKRKLEEELRQKELELRELENRERQIFIKHLRNRDLGIWVGSWNLAGKEFDLNENFVEWTQTKESKHDIYVFNFQEFIKLNFINIATAYTDENKKQQFEYSVQKVLSTNTGYEYVKLKSISMAGLYLVIFAKKILDSYVRDVLVSNVKTGFYYNIGNKGSVGIQFNIFEYNLTFLNIHLNFGQNLSVRRVALLEYVLKNSFKKYDKSVMDSEFLVVAGDFNFNVLLEKPTVLSLLERMEYSVLLSYDEFNIAKINGTDILNKLYESKIHFEPTYKYKGGTKHYTTSRSPAWCDRILFGGKLPDSKKAQILSYRRSDNLMTSDHRPVSSAFIVEFDK